MNIERFEDMEAWQKESEERKRANRNPDNLSRDKENSTFRFVENGLGEEVLSRGPSV